MVGRQCLERRMSHGKLTILAVEESRFITEGTLLDFVIDFRYLNILLLLAEASGVTKPGPTRA